MPSRLRTVKVLMREHARVSRVDRVATQTFELENPRTVMVYKIPALGNGKIQKSTTSILPLPREIMPSSPAQTGAQHSTPHPPPTPAH